MAVLTKLNDLMKKGVVEFHAFVYQCVLLQSKGIGRSDAAVSARQI